MKSPVSLTLAALPVLIAANCFAASEPFTLKVEGMAANQPIGEKYAMCKPTPDGKSAPSQNWRPTISWDNAPKGAQSFAVLVSDPDVPADFSKANKDGQLVEENASRKEYYHWALADIPGNVARIPGGDTAVGIGAPVANDLKGFVKDPHDFGGPCPPWNDARVHRYYFTVYALDVKSLGLSTDAKASDLAQKLNGNPHVLAKSQLVGTYTTNPALR